MISFAPHSDFAATVQASLMLEAGRTLRWKPVAEREAISEFLATHWYWVETELKPFWKPLAELHVAEPASWDRENNSEARRLMAAFDLRLTALLQQAWIRILLAKK
jgi:hypothetical protein